MDNTTFWLSSLPITSSLRRQMLSKRSMINSRSIAVNLHVELTANKGS
jgi:hypothetical protein